MKCSLIHFYTNVAEKLLYKRFSIEDCKASNHESDPDF